VHSVENAIVKHVISEFIRLISIQGGSVFIFTTSKFHNNFDHLFI